MQIKFPKELGEIQLNLFRIDVHRPDVNTLFDFVSVVQSCELVRFCFTDHNFYTMEMEQFRWVIEGLFLLNRVLSKIYDNKYYWDVQKYAEKSIHEHPLCIAWKSDIANIRKRSFVD